MDFKEKAKRVKEIYGNIEKLEKSVQARLMGVADKLAPMVQGAGIAPKAIRIPEPTEYPDIKETVVPMGVKKHQLEQFADQFLKADWHPVAKTQKNPSTTIPYEEKPTHRDYIAPTNNVTGNLKADRDTKNAVSPAIPPELHASGAMNKSEDEGEHGRVPHSELAMHTRIAGKKITGYKIHPHHAEITVEGSHTPISGTHGEVLSHKIKERHGLNKAEMHTSMPSTTPIKPPARNIPDEPKKKVSKIL